MKLYLLNVEGSTNFIGGNNLSEAMGIVDTFFAGEQYSAIVFEVDHRSLKSLSAEEANAIVLSERRSLN